MDYTPIIGKLIALRSGTYRILEIVRQGTTWHLAVAKPEGIRNKWLVSVNEDGLQVSGLTKF